MKPNNQSWSVRCSVSLPNELYEFAKQEGYSLSALLRNGLENKRILLRCNAPEGVEATWAKRLHSIPLLSQGGIHNRQNIAYPRRFSTFYPPFTR